MMIEKYGMDFGFEPSPYQEKIFDFILHGNGNAVISAKAGSAKTSTCVAAVQLINKKEKVMFVAFNRSIAEELTEKLKSKRNVSVSTTHSLGYAMCISNIGQDIELDEYKYSKYIKSNIGDITSLFGKNLTKAQINEYIDNVISLVNLSRYNLAQSADEVMKLSVKYDIPVLFDECDTVVKVLEWGKSNTKVIDFTDMIWLPVELSMDAKRFQKDFIFVDECQDQSLMSIALLEKCRKRGTRFIFVGDEKQCQPKGTKILLPNNEEKNIEYIEIGDKIVTYKTKELCFKGYTNNECSKVIDVEHHIENKLVKIKTDNNFSSSYTPSHICYGRINDNNCCGKYILYLMCDDEGVFRIGTLGLANKNNNTLGLSLKMKEEKCNRAWVLDVFDTYDDAKKFEELDSYAYELPSQRIIKKLNVNDDKSVKSENVKGLCNILLKYNLIAEKAKLLLGKYGRDIKYPFCNSNKMENVTNEHIFQINACNLMPKIMDVGCYDDEKKSIKYTNICEIEIVNGEFEVYSIEVENEHNYVADKILTHNCINTFAGSSEDAFEMMKNMPNTTIFELPICYRCPKVVVELAKTIVPEIESRENAIDGKIIENCYTTEFKNGDMVLCRSKAPLLKVYTKLLNKGIPCHIKGQDIGVNMKSFIEDVDIEELNPSLNADGLFVRLYDKLFDIRNKLMINKGLDYQDATLSAYVMEKYDMINALIVLAQKYKTKKELLSHIDDIFDEANEGVILSTIHKAKGLEADNVYILCSSSMPSKLARKDWEKKAEENLIYVAYTRAKKILGFVSEKEIKPFGISQGPDAVLNELGIIENLVCHILGKTPVDKKESADIARFTLKNNGITKIEDEHKNDNCKIISESNEYEENNDLLDELDELLTL